MPGFWSGYVVPLLGANTTDGVGLGVAGELFERAAREDHGYRLKITASTYETVTLGYTSQYGQLEVRGDSTWIVRGGYQTWNDLPYAGAGGAQVLLLSEDERGNTIRSPYAMVVAAAPLAIDGWRIYGQVYLHPAWVEAAPGGLLDRRDPFGAEGGVYGDVGVGVELDTTDRWPLPTRGTRAEIGLRAGGTGTPEAIAPLAGLYAEAIHWVALVPDDPLVAGLRLQVEKSSGPRPLWEQGVSGGRWRDELGFEQVLSGYGRIRTRGDGLAAAAVELRPHLGGGEIRGLRLDVFLSAFAELAWLFAGSDPGPPLPSLGLGPEVLYQRASQLRPFVSFGWRAEEPGGRRRPLPQIGLSVTDPL